MRDLFPKSNPDNAPSLRAYWENIYGPRPKMDFSAPVPPYKPEPPSCSHCGDLGVFKYDVPLEDPRFGKLFDCERCETGQERTRQRWLRKYQNSEFPRQFRRFTFESWNTLVSDEAMDGKRPAYLAAVQFVERSDHMVDLYEIFEQLEMPWDESRDLRPKNSLVFHGPMGNGKTGLMSAIVNELLARDEACLYSRIQEFIADVQATYDAESPRSTEAVMMKYKRAPVLFLDEVNIHNVSRDRLDKIEELIRYRYNNDLPTLMTMNIDQQEFADMWDGRSADAAIAMAHWVYVGGAKLRRTDPSVY